MTVKQLIEELKKVPEDMQDNINVFVRGYEGGYNDAKFKLKINDFHLNYYTEWYYGKHEIVDSTYYKQDNNKKDIVIVKGIVL